MTQLYTRERSTNFKPMRCEPGEKPRGVVQYPCGRCGGLGRIHAYRHIEGGICFQCGGTRRGPEKIVPLYTAEQLDALDARAAKAAEKRAAKAREKAQAEQEARQAAVRARFEKLQSDPTYLRLKAFEGRSEFVAKMLDVITYSDLTEAQEAAALAACAKIEESDRRKAASEYVGRVGERVKFRGRVEMLRCIHEAEGYWDRDRWLIKIRTSEGSALTWFTGSAACREGEEVTGSATVKAHEEYRGERSTLIKNARFS